MSNLELFDRAAGQATCQVLNAAGYGLVGAGAASLWAAGTGFAAMGAGAISLLASNYLCPDMPLGGTEPNPQLDGCVEVDGYGVLQVLFEGNWIMAFPPGNTYYPQGQVAQQILNAEVVEAGGGVFIARIQWKTSSGGVVESSQYQGTNEEQIRSLKWKINPTSGSCVKHSNDPQPLPPEATDPIPYTDTVTNCNYTVQLQGFAQSVPDGGVNPVFLIEAEQTLRADGGRMGGCNFPPTIYMPQPGGGGGGGGISIPVPDGGAPGPGPGGIPWWAGPLAGAAAGAILNQIFDLIGQSLTPTIGESSFTLVAPCNKDESGNPETRTWQFPTQTEPQRLLTHQVALMQILQQHLDWKTPICDETTIPEGDFRTISFRSDETSPYGKSRLRKRFRYRAVSGNDLGAIVDHWKDFAWEGGPYRVRWIGGPWRSPEIWAASEAEGQRVIQHAAEEAGFSPLEGGRWSTRLSSSGRQGVPGTMRVDTTKGFYWITARDGSDERPIVAKT